MLWEDKITKEDVYERIEKRRTLLNNIPHRKASWIGHLRRSYLLGDVIKGQMTEVKGRRRRQLLEDLTNRKKILGAKGGSWRSKKMETTVY